MISLPPTTNLVSANVTRGSGFGEDLFSLLGGQVTASCWRYASIRSRTDLPQISRFHITLESSEDCSVSRGFSIIQR